MTNESQSADTAGSSSSIEMPKPTVAPLVLALGIALAAMGMADESGIFVRRCRRICRGTGNVDLAALARSWPLA